MSSLVAIERVSIQDLKGKTVYELEPEEFEKLFCQRCCDYGSCSRKPTRMVHCRVLVEVGRWSEFYGNRNGLRG